MTEINMILDSIVNGQRKQAWRYMIQYNIDLDDIADEIGLNEFRSMYRVGISSGILVVNKEMELCN